MDNLTLNLTLLARAFDEVNADATRARAKGNAALEARIAATPYVMTATIAQTDAFIAAMERPHA
jgi:hypothetical protein